MRSLRRVLIAAWLPVVLVAAWWFGTANSSSPFFPPLERILERFDELWLFSQVGSQVVPSLTNLALGFATALVIGLTVGVILALLPTVELIVDPVLHFARSLPAVALLPLLLVVAGIGTTYKVLAISMGAVWPILLSTIDGIKAIDPEVRRTSRVYRLTRSTVLWRVLLPGATPQIAAGVRTSLGISVILMVGSELYASSSGIGYFVMQSQQTYAVADMWSGVILLGIIGYVLNLGYLAIERRLLRWRPESAGL
jgi:ABC-type nitrate/sulfonate/bicarbonate transport system permease component